LAAPAAVALLTFLGRGAAPAPARAAEPPPQQAPGAAAADPRAADVAAIRAALEGFARAFDARDAKALAACWTAGGEYRNEAGIVVTGREALESGFAAFFARTPEVKAELRPEAPRFLAADAAIGEGSVTVRRGPSEPPSRATYKALLVREGGRWLLAQMSETPAPDASIEDLAWLVGEWASRAGDGAEIRTVYSFVPSRKFLVGRFTIKEKGLELSGTQIVGVDPATGSIHGWTFEADGGIGEADWRPDGDHWVLDMTGTLADGRTLTETNILRRVNGDTFTWQSIDRLLDDAELADLPPVKVVRVKPQP
jgi:uncharacterized protein (TIGR02246 family)